jgi:hypothetical protein
MTIRTSLTNVTFGRPFVLGGFDEKFPEGIYTVETDEELLEGISFLAYRRISTLIHLKPDPRYPGRMRTLAIDPKELDAALARDQAAADSLGGRNNVQKTETPTKESLGKEADREAIDRADDEGMIIRPR